MVINIGKPRLEKARGFLLSRRSLHNLTPQV
jgi:hypothetical protein